MKTQEKQAEPHDNLIPVAAEKVLDNFFLEARSKLLDMAAILDRIQRGMPPRDLQNDTRMIKIRQAIQLLLQENPARAEQIQQIFSLAYDPKWVRPQPK